MNMGVFEIDGEGFEKAREWGPTFGVVRAANDPRLAIKFYNEGFRALFLAWLRKNEIDYTTLV